MSGLTSIDAVMPADYTIHRPQPSRAFASTTAAVFELDATSTFATYMYSGVLLAAAAAWPTQAGNPPPSPPRNRDGAEQAPDDSDHTTWLTSSLFTPPASPASDVSSPSPPPCHFEIDRSWNSTPPQSSGMTNREEQTVSLRLRRLPADVQLGVLAACHSRRGYRFWIEELEKAEWTLFWESLTEQETVWTERLLDLADYMERTNNALEEQRNLINEAITELRTSQPQQNPWWRDFRLLAADVARFHVTTFPNVRHRDDVFMLISRALYLRGHQPGVMKGVSRAMNKMLFLLEAAHCLKCDLETFSMARRDTDRWFTRLWRAIVNGEDTGQRERGEALEHRGLTWMQSISQLQSLGDTMYEGRPWVLRIARDCRRRLARY